MGQERKCRALQTSQGLSQIVLMLNFQIKIQNSAQKYYKHVFIGKQKWLRTVYNMLYVEYKRRIIEQLS